MGCPIKGDRGDASGSYINDNNANEAVSVLFLPCPFHPFTQSFNRCLLDTYYIPGKKNADVKATASAFKGRTEPGTKEQEPYYDLAERKLGGGEAGASLGGSTGLGVSLVKEGQGWVPEIPLLTILHLNSHRGTTRPSTEGQFP